MTTIGVQSGKGGSLMELFGLSLSFWERAFFVATAVAALAGAISVISAAIAGVVGYEVADQLFKSNERQIAEANARVSEATESAAKANARAAEANQMAEQEKLARIKLEAAVAPRSLSVEQARQVTESLKPFRGARIEITSYSLDLESAMLGGQVGAAIHAAGIEVVDNRAAVMPMGGFAIGVHVQGSSSGLVAALRKTISNAGIAVAATDPPALTGMTAPAPQTGGVLASILIGAKPIAPIP